MDALAYNYKTTNNQLTSVDDKTAYSGNYGLDIDDQAANNYEYDAIGNMTKDITGGVDAIEWNVYGKIASIAKPGSTITYGYEASGNRISKTVGDKQTIYVRDASGNTISVYEKIATDPLRQLEQWIYGSNRLGLQSEHKFQRVIVPLSGSYGNAEVDVLTRGEKLFELSNHLGNVLATVSDRKLAIEGTSGIVGYYKADVASAQDYYPFGMLMPGRMFGVDESVTGGTVNGTTQVNGHSVPVELSVNSRTGGAPTEYVASNGIELGDGFESGATDDFSAYIADGSYAGTGNQGGGSGSSQGNEGLYRYGFNGKENDNEVKGTGNQVGFEARVYDPRLGRFFSPDPIEANYPFQSTYVFAANNPISLIDYLGLGPDDPPIAKSSDGRNINIPNDATVEYNKKTKDGKDISTTTANSGAKINIASGSVRAINTKGGRFVASYDSEGSFVGYKNFKSGEVMKSFETIFFEATGSVVDSKEMIDKIDGKGIYNEAKMMEKSIIGVLYIRAHYDDGSSKLINGYGFTSGPHGNGPLPNWNYDVYSFSWTSQAGMKLNGGKQGFKLFLSDRPDLGRGAFRIHPDCNSWGTAGCMGLRRNDGTKYNNTVLRNFASSMNNYRKKHPVINLSFQVPNNPNYADQGKKVPGN